MTDNRVEPGPRGTRSVRGHLAVFTAALVLPVLAFLAFLLWWYAATERKRLETDTLEVAVEIANLVDRDFAGLFTSLETLASSPALQNNDLQAFYGQATDLVRRLGFITVLNDIDGQLLVNVRLPWGTALPKTGLTFTREEASTGRPFVTNLFGGRVSGRYIYSPALGILRDGKPVSVMSFALEPERLRKIFEEVALPAEMIAAVIDRNGRIVARSRDHDRFVGHPAAQDFLDGARGRTGTWSGATKEGTQSFGAYTTSRYSEFKIGVALSDEALQRPLWRSVSLFLALGAVVAGLSTVLGIYFAPRITRPMEALAGRATALGRGEGVAELATGLREADEVGRELARAADTRLSREADLRDANEEVQRFAYIVSHDLRSPLVNIMGFTTELETLREHAFKRLEALRRPDDQAERNEDRRLAEDVDEAIGFIKASIGKMDRLIAAILKLSREGQRNFKPERIDMDALVEGIRRSVAHQAEEAGATIVTGRLPPVTSDRLSLEQVFSNLIDNAVKYLRRGVPGRVEVSGRETPTGLVYEVRDNGRGIDPKDNERVFELFRRSGAQDRPGEGIGLAHVRALVRRLGGTIVLTSTPGQGSVFQVTLPRRWTAEAKREAA